MTERMPLVLWKDVAPELRADRRVYRGFMPPTHRGCGGAVMWPDGEGWHRCAQRRLSAYGLCRSHAERAGLVPRSAERVAGPRGLPPEIGNAITRQLRRYEPRLTVGHFRTLTDHDLLSWANIGPVRLGAVRSVRDTWTDEELCSAFGFETGGLGICNWVGEGVPSCRAA